MRLPDGLGLELLRAEERASGEKAIVITAYGSAENAVEALKAGAYDYLTKPVDLKQFRGVVAGARPRPDVPDHACRRARAPAPARASAPARARGRRRRRCSAWSRGRWRPCDATSKAGAR